MVKFVLFFAVALIAHTPVQGMMAGDADTLEEARAPASRHSGPDISTLEKMWDLTKKMADRNETEQLRHVAIRALQNPERVSNRPDGVFSVDISPAAQGSKISLKFDFHEKRTQTIQFLTSYSELDLRLGKKAETLQEFYKLCKEQKDLLSLHSYFPKIRKFEDGSFSWESLYGCSMEEALSGSFTATARLCFSFVSARGRFGETLSYVYEKDARVRKKSIQRAAKAGRKASRVCP